MNKIEDKFLIDAKAKKYAIKFFPAFFRKDLCVSSCFRLSDLKIQYLKYCVEYFTNYSDENCIERFSIQTAYEYLKMILTNQENFELDTRISKKLLGAYQRLISCISNYHFIPHSNNSYGAKQNKTNEKLLFDISLLYPVLIATLENIDSYFRNISEPEKIDDFYCILINKIKNLIKSLNDTHFSLLDEQQRYYEIWGYVARPNTNVTHADLGYKKKEWRLERNKAVRTILDLYKELENINIALYYGTFEYSEKNYGLDQATLEVSQNYNNGIKNIINGPYYFCYLNDEEKQEIAVQKFLKRTKAAEKK